MNKGPSTEGDSESLVLPKSLPWCLPSRPTPEQQLLSELRDVMETTARESRLYFTDTSSEIAQKRLLYLFIKDLSAGINGKILEAKNQRDSQSVERVSLFAKVMGWVVISGLNAAMLFYVFLFARQQTHSRQYSWFLSFVIWICFDVFVVSSGVVFITHVAIPSWIMKDLKSIKRKLLAEVIAFKVKLARKESIAFTDPNQADDDAFNAACYLFVSTRLARDNPGVMGSDQILAFSTPYPTSSFRTVKADVQSSYQKRLGFFSQFISRVMIFLLTSLLHFSAPVQDSIIELCSISGLGYIMMLAVRLFTIHPLLPFASLLVIIVIVHFGVSSNKYSKKLHKTDIYPDVDINKVLPPAVFAQFNNPNHARRMSSIGRMAERRPNCSQVKGVETQLAPGVVGGPAELALQSEMPSMVTIKSDINECDEKNSEACNDHHGQHLIGQASPLVLDNAHLIPSSISHKKIKRRQSIVNMIYRESDSSGDDSDNDVFCDSSSEGTSSDDDPFPTAWRTRKQTLRDGKRIAKQLMNQQKQQECLKSGATFVAGGPMTAELLSSQPKTRETIRINGREVIVKSQSFNFPNRTESSPALSRKTIMKSESMGADDKDVSSSLARTASHRLPSLNVQKQIGLAPSQIGIGGTVTARIAVQAARPITQPAQRIAETDNSSIGVLTEQTDRRIHCPPLTPSAMMSLDIGSDFDEEEQCDNIEKVLLCAKTDFSVGNVFASMSEGTKISGRDTHVSKFSADERSAKRKEMEAMLQERQLAKKHLAEQQLPTQRPEHSKSLLVSADLSSDDELDSDVAEIRVVRRVSTSQRELASPIIANSSEIRSPVFRAKSSTVSDVRAVSSGASRMSRAEVELRQRLAARNQKQQQGNLGASSEVDH